MKKLLLLILVLFLVVLIVLAADIDRNDGLVNVSYSGTINVISELVNVSIPRYSTINNSILDLEGFVEYCYQETANVSTSCGGLDTGTYYYNFLEDPNNAFDGDWDTYSYHQPSQDGSLYVNYTKPSFTNNAIWQVKDSSATINLTVPDECFGTFTDKISFRIFSQAINRLNWYCYNGTTFQNLRQITASAFFEEAILWNGSYPTNITVKTDNVKVYENLTELNETHPMNNINLNNNSALQNCVDTCSNQDGAYCICPINISSGYSGKTNYSINISYNPYSWSYASGTQYELTNQQYGLTVPRLPNSTDLSDVKAVLEFDGTLYTPTKTPYSDRYVFNKTIIPQIDNMTSIILHHWIFNMSYLNDTLELFAMNNQTQTFNKLSIGLCTNVTFNSTILNLTLNDEETLSALNSDLEVAFESIYADNILYTLNVSFNFSNINQTSFCLNTNYTAKFDAIFVYTSSTYTQRIYNFLENLSYTATNFLNLYLSNDGNLTNIYLTLYDENSERLSNYYVTAERFYPYLSDYKNIETVKSDISGEVLLHLIPLAKEYRLKVFDPSGNLVKTIPRTTIKSSTVTITVPTEVGYLRDYDDAVGASYSLDFDNSTKEVTWQSTTTAFPQSCLSVIRLTDGGKLLYDNCQSGSIITDTYTITEDTDEQTYVFRGYFKKSSGAIVGVAFKEHTEVKTHLRFGDIGILITIILFVTLFMLGIYDPAVAIFLGTVGLLVSLFIGFIPLMMSTVVLIIIMVGFLLYKMKT